MRELYRSIARQRLKDMGVRRVNRHFGQGVAHSHERKVQKNPKRFAMELKARKLHPANWRRALWGDLAKLYRNQRNIRRRRKEA